MKRSILIEEAEQILRPRLSAGDHIGILTIR